MHTHMYQIDAFANELFKGNPAAVVILAHELSDHMMQNIAQENNQSETAFVLPSKNGLGIRWFTTTTEIDLCGHATLAAAYVLFNHEDFEGDQVIFQSKSGPLKVTNSDGALVLDFPVDQIKQIYELPALMKLDSKHLVKEVYKGNTDLMFVLSNQQQVADYVPNLDLIKQLGTRGLIVTAPGDNTDFVSRFFAPNIGINEDPVTGSAHTTLTPFWAKRLKKNKLIAAQLSSRGGKLTCELSGNSVLIGGTCQIFLKGELYI